MNKLIGSLFYFTNTTAYYGIIALHFWTVYITFKVYGFGWSALSFFIPIISNIYIAIKEYKHNGYVTYYVFLTIMFFTILLVSFILAFLHKPEEVTQ